MINKTHRQWLSRQNSFFFSFAPSTSITHIQHTLLIWAFVVNGRLQITTMMIFLQRAVVWLSNQIFSRIHKCVRGEEKMKKKSTTIHSRNSTESQHAAVTSLRRAEREEKSEKSKRTAEVRNQWWLIEHNWKWPASQRKKRVDRDAKDFLNYDTFNRTRCCCDANQFLISLFSFVRGISIDEKSHSSGDIWIFLDFFSLSLASILANSSRIPIGKRKKFVIQYRRRAVVRCRNWKLRWEICFNFDILWTLWVGKSENEHENENI